MLKLDKKDAKILFELDKNSRQSINQIAKKTKLSRDVVNYRIKQLEQKQIIKNYVTIVDFTKFGFQIIRLYLKLQNTTPEIETKIIHYLTKQQNTFTVYKIDGRYDIAVGYLAKDVITYQTFYASFLKKFRRYIAEKNFSIFQDYVHYTRNYLTQKKKYDSTTISTGSHKTYNYDTKDVQLLNLIKEDARISLLELAKKLKMTATGVKYKLKNLEQKKVIVAYKLLLDTQKLGNQYFKVDLELEDISILPALQQFILQHPNVIYRNITIGGSDFEFDCELPSQQDFYVLINQLKTLFAEKIRHYFYYKALQIYKYSYFPEHFPQKP